MKGLFAPATAVALVLVSCTQQASSPTPTPTRTPTATIAPTVAPTPAPTPTSPIPAVPAAVAVEIPVKGAGLLVLDITTRGVQLTADLRRLGAEDCGSS